MRKLRHAVWREGVNQTGDEPRAGAAGDLAHEEKCAKAGEDERRKKQQVVGKDDVARQCVDWQYLDRLGDEVLRVGQGERLGMKDVGAPEAPQSAQVAGKKTQQMIGVPREDPRVQERVAEIQRDVARDAGRERPGEEERDAEIKNRGS